uniref:Putative secreted protein n=1 Tax=Anopheles marajoara TaxID=58244 RepID=A0A2M4CCF0_9DIPT
MMMYVYCVVRLGLPMVEAPEAVWWWSTTERGWRRKRPRIRWSLYVWPFSSFLPLAPSGGVRVPHSVARYRNLLRSP